MNLQEIKERAHSAWRILRGKDSNLVAHARRELEALGYFDGAEINEMMATDLIESVRIFASQQHSGFSAAYALGALTKLLAFEPLGPLTGEDSEWTEVAEGVFQNKRCSRVFKQADRFDGQAYDLNAVVFREPDGGCFTNRDSMQPISFPYTPSTEYRDAPGER